MFTHNTSVLLLTISLNMHGTRELSVNKWENNLRYLFEKVTLIFGCKSKSNALEKRNMIIYLPLFVMHYNELLLH